MVVTVQLTFIHCDHQQFIRGDSKPIDILPVLKREGKGLVAIRVHMEQDQKQIAMHTVEDFIIRICTSKLKMCTSPLGRGGWGRG